MAEAFNFNQKSENNWIRAAYGLKFLKNGLESFIDRHIKKQHEDLKDKLVNDTSNPATSCTSCTRDNLLPNHPTRVCILPKRRAKCFCSTSQNRRKCPNHFCSRFYDAIVSAHAENNPIWQNTDPGQWFSDHWELAKCYLGTTGYQNKCSACETDVTGLLTIVINDLALHDAVDNINNFVEVRNVRNDLFHSKTLNVTDDELGRYVDQMIAVLQDKKHLSQDGLAKQAVTELQKLKQNQICISSEEEDELRKQAIYEVTRKSINEINEANIKSLSEITMKGEEIKSDVSEMFEKEKRVRNDTSSDGANLFKEKPPELLREYLINLYRNVYCKVDILPLTPEDDDDIDNIYVPVVLEGIYRDTGQKVAICRVQNLFRPPSKGSEMVSTKNVFVYADAGVGKTTFCKRLVSLWCHAYEDYSSDRTDLCLAEDISKEMHPGSKGSPRHLTDVQSMRLFHFVFVVSLRNATDEHYLEEMIVKQLSLNKTQAKIFKEVITNSKYRCLVIVDGLDEWERESKISKSPIISKDLPGRKNLGYSVLFTTRPWKAAESKIKKSEIKLEVSIKGIPFKSSQALTERLNLCKQTHIQNSTFSKTVIEKGLRDFLQTPLLNKLLFALWIENGTLPQSRCGIYSGVIDLLIRYAFERNENDQNFLRDISFIKQNSNESENAIPTCFRGLSNCKECINLLRIIASFGFKSYFNNGRGAAKQLVIKGRDIAAYSLTDKELVTCLKCGFLTQHKDSTSLTIREKIISFTHLSFHEYFAALHVSILLSNEDLHILKKSCISIENLLEHANVLKFVYGMSSKTTNPFNDVVGRVMTRNFKKINRDLLSSRWLERRVLIGLSNLYADCTFESSEIGETADIPFDHLYLSDKTFESVARSSSNIKPKHFYCSGRQSASRAPITDPELTKLFKNVLPKILNNCPDNIETLHLECIRIYYRPILNNETFSNLSTIRLFYVNLDQKFASELLMSPALLDVCIKRMSFSLKNPELQEAENPPVQNQAKSRQSKIRKIHISWSDISSFGVFSKDQFNCMRLLVLRKVTVGVNQASIMINSPQLVKIHLTDVTFVSENETMPAEQEPKDLNVEQSKLLSLTVRNSKISCVEAFYRNKMPYLGRLFLSNVCLSPGQGANILTSPKLHNVHLFKVSIETHQLPCEQEHCDGQCSIFTHIQGFPSACKLVFASDNANDIIRILNSSPLLRSVSLIYINLNKNPTMLMLNHLKRLRLIRVQCNPRSLDILVNSLPTGVLTTVLK